MFKLIFGGMLAIASSTLAYGMSLNGYTEPIKEINMSFPEAGIIKHIHVEEGDTVTQGQVLVELDNELYEIEKDSLKHRVKKLKTRTDKLDKLSEGNQASTEETEKAMLELRLEENQLKKVLAQLRRRTLTCPLKQGVIKEVNFKEDEGVSGLEKVVLTLINTEQLKLYFYAPTELARRLEQGKPVEIHCEGYSGSRQGSISFIDPTVDKASKTQRVAVLIDNQDNPLPSGLLATVDLES